MTDETRYSEEELVRVALAYAELGIRGALATADYGNGKKYLEDVHAVEFLESLANIKSRVPEHLLAQFPRLNELEDRCYELAGKGDIERGKRRLKDILALKERQKQERIFSLIC